MCYVRAGVSYPPCFFLFFFFGCLSSLAFSDVSVGTAERTAPPELHSLLGVYQVQWRVHTAALTNHSCDPCLISLVLK